MRISSLKVEDFPPIRLLEISNLTSPVIIAGANGSGKTRLKDGISNTFRSPSSPQISVSVLSTRPEEAESFKTECLEVIQGQSSNQLQEYMNTRTRGGTYTGSVIQIDSNRSIQPVKFQALTLFTPDPDDAEINYTYYLDSFTNRWQELVNKIYQKVANRDHKILDYVKSNLSKTGNRALRANPDPFVPYQDVFAKLLHGKQLMPIDPKQLREFQYKIGDSDPLAFQTLSSGEQEVVKISFDLIWRRIRHCVILLDEPELHLHPTLVFRLIETLKEIGEGTNQLILFTHSADLISTYYATGNVFFIDIEKQEGNQVGQLSDLRDRHVATARMIGTNLGLFAVGKRLIFVEGAESSVDRLTYHKIAQRSLPNSYVIPIGSVNNINTLSEVTGELQQAIFGINLFMIRDHDGLSDEQVENLHKNPHVRCLSRRHIENYFLNPDILAKVAEHFYQDPSKADSTQIEAKLFDIAKDCLNTALALAVKEFISINGSLDVPKVKSPDTKSIDDVAAEISKQVIANSESLQSKFDESAINSLIRHEQKTLQSSLSNGQWKALFPGKLILSRFVGTFWDLDLNHVRQAYVDIALEQDPDVFADIIQIFRHFRSLCNGGN